MPCAPRPGTRCVAGGKLQLPEGQDKLSAVTACTTTLTGQLHRNYKTSTTLKELTNRGTFPVSLSRAAS